MWGGRGPDNLVRRRVFGLVFAVWVAQVGSTRPHHVPLLPAPCVRLRLEGPTGLYTDFSLLVVCTPWALWWWLSLWLWGVGSPCCVCRFPNLHPSPSYVVSKPCTEHKPHACVCDSPLNPLPPSHCACTCACNGAWTDGVVGDPPVLGSHLLPDHLDRRHPGRPGCTSDCGLANWRRGVLDTAGGKGGEVCRGRGG